MEKQKDKKEKIDEKEIQNEAFLKAQKLQEIGNKVTAVLNDCKITYEEAYVILRGIVNEAENKYFSNEEGKRFIEFVNNKLKVANMIFKQQQNNIICENKEKTNTSERPKYVG